MGARLDVELAAVRPARVRAVPPAAGEATSVSAVRTASAAAGLSRWLCAPVTDSVRWDPGRRTAVTREGCTARPSFAIVAIIAAIWRGVPSTSPPPSPSLPIWAPWAVSGPTVVSAPRPSPSGCAPSGWSRSWKPRASAVSRTFGQPSVPAIPMNAVLHETASACRNEIMLLAPVPWQRPCGSFSIDRGPPMFSCSGAGTRVAGVLPDSLRNAAATTTLNVEPDHCASPPVDLLGRKRRKIYRGAATAADVASVLGVLRCGVALPLTGRKIPVADVVVVRDRRLDLASAVDRSADPAVGVPMAVRIGLDELGQRLRGRSAATALSRSVSNEERAADACGEQRGPRRRG
jgi:hypothetical protein